MIAAHEDFPQVARTGRYFVGAGAISYDVSQIHDPIERRSSGKAGFKSFKIGVNIA
jgi:hypothetical protein